MLGKKHKLKKISKTEPSFLLKLYQILTNQEYHSYIHWSYDGLSIIISDPTGLTKKVLPKFYNHHNFASFVRQLNMYNFHKIRTDPKVNEQKYYHNEFYRGKTIKEIQEIRRKIKNDDDKDKDKSGEKDKNNNSDKKININIRSNENLLDDKILLDEIEGLDDATKFTKYINILNSGEVSSLSNDKILGFLLDKLKENEEETKNVQNEINNLVKQNNNLLQQLQICNNKLASQKDFCKKMKGLVIFLVTLLMRKKQNYKICRVDINGNKGDNNNKKTTNLVDFVNKYLAYHNNKNINTANINININNNDSLKESNININSKNGNNNINNININNNKKQNNNLIPTIQKGENFMIKENNDLFQNLNTNNNEEDNDNSLNNSFSKHFNFDLDLKRGNNNSISSINLFNSSMNFGMKK